MMKLRKNLLAALLLGALALGGVACTSDDAGEDATEADTAAPEAEDTATEADTAAEEETS